MAKSFVIPAAAINLSLLILALSALATAQFIIDNGGKPVVNGGRYSIVRNFQAPDAGSLSWLNKTKSCPLYVVEGLMPIDALHAPPADVFLPPPFASVTIRSPLRSRFIPLGATFDITFNDKKTPCKNQPLKWSIKPVGSIKNAFYLVAGCTTKPCYKSGSFKVVNTVDDFSGPNVYRLLYCFDHNHKHCLQVGNFPSDRVFGITTNPNVKLFPIDLTFNGPPPSA